MENHNRYAKVTELNGRPRLLEALPLAMQHVVAMIVGCVTPAIILAGVTGLEASEQIILIQSALLISGVATLLQLFPLGRFCGSGLPVIMGASFAYIPLLISLGSRFDLPTIFGAQLVGGLAAVAVGLFYKKLTRLFPPLVTGTVVFTIGLSLYPTAVNYMAGGVGAEDFGSPRNWLVAVVTLAIVLFFNYFTRGICKLASILMGMIFGYALALVMGMVSFENVNAAGWFQFTMPMHFGMKFELTSIISMLIMYIVSSVEAIGDFTSTAGGGLDREPEEREMCGGIIGNGIASIIGAFMGGLPTATFSQNVGIVIMTKVVNRCVLGLAALIILAAGFIPKFASLLTTIPSSVLGGATVSVFAMIAMTGIKLITKEKLTARNTSVVGLAVALGIGVIQANGCLALFPDWARTIFGESAVVIATITAVTLNLILPEAEEEREAGAAKIARANG
ncbi:MULTISPECIES: nucleobase:cation symporter-2 family protein [Enterocloster]|uniref:Nucleobase:cation symporter-2, NCS2 family n=1 Tax=Enterocloster lavalensis TaxID=460384 RepID=A0A1I0IPB5_9FIRM|nr:MULTISPECIES: nucleobase:cation symporter-2 family protein [Enterocloster]MDR3759857.1 nucleobase:cation symporter-2 family protein [Enterocloster sp.]PST33646.1 purine permease [Enterocloster lavalensis]SET98209.1 nucleobase:cation symporter-2, NCS2 family [Enterocloster lavalensis]